MSKERYFLALELPQAHREALGRFRGEERGLVWTRVSQLHVTLRFIGELEAERVDDLVKALSKVRVAPFILPLEGAGAFPTRGLPRVVWVGLGNAHPHLFQLRQRVDDALLAVGLDVDLRAFHPHVTIARVKPGTSPVAVEHYLKKRSGFAGPPFRVEHFALYASELGPDGAEHKRVASFPLDEAGA